MTGAAPVPVALTQRYMDMGIGIRQVYGLTESCGPACLMDAEDSLRKPDSTGKSFYHTEVRVVNEAGEDCAPGEPGEVLVAGAHIMREYWNRPEATAETMVDGWLRTGDVATMDAEGFVSIQDRIKDMIISGGENVYPAEIEGVLATHADIADAAVIGQPSETWGESPLAVVVRSFRSAYGSEMWSTTARGGLPASSSPRPWCSPTRFRAIPAARSSSGCCAIGIRAHRRSDHDWNSMSRYGDGGCHRAEYDRMPPAGAQSGPDDISREGESIMQVSKVTRAAMDLTRVPTASAAGEAFAAVRALGLEQHLAEIEGLGFTVIPPELAGTRGLAPQLLQRICEISEQNRGQWPDTDAGTSHADPVYPVERQEFLLAKGRIFEEALMNPVVQAMVRYLVGEDAVLSTCVGRIRGPGILPLMLHTDQAFHPVPLPLVCNINFLLSDYSRENGALCFVPGSHRLQRNPLPEENFYLGGLDRPGAEAAVTAGEPLEVRDPPGLHVVEAPAGSLAVWPGNTWHGALASLCPRPALQPDPVLLQQVAAPPGSLPRMPAAGDPRPQRRAVRPLGRFRDLLRLGSGGHRVRCGQGVRRGAQAGGYDLSSRVPWH